MSGIPELAKLIAETIESNPAWQLVSFEHDYVRAIPNQLKDALPPIGSSINGPGSAWLTLDFWIDKRPRPRLGVFWTSNPVRDVDVRKIVLTLLLERRGSGLEYKGTKGPWQEIDGPVFSGKTVSNHSWWPSGEEPDLNEARNIIRDQLKAWSSCLPQMLEAASAASKKIPTINLTTKRDRRNEPSRNPSAIGRLKNEERASREQKINLTSTLEQTATSIASESRLTPPLPGWVREDQFQPHYKNIHALLLDPRLTTGQRAENTRRLYGTETMDGFNDWNASTLLLAKDAGPTQIFLRLIEEGDGVHCKERPCTQPWRHAIPPEKGSATNENLRLLTSILPGTKLYGSVMAGLLRNDGLQSGPLPNFYDPKLQQYLRRVIEEVVFAEMKNLRVVICLGNEACEVVGAVIGSRDLMRNFRALRDAATPIEFDGKRVFASYHTSPRAMANAQQVEKAKRVLFAAKRILEHAY